MEMTYEATKKMIERVETLTKQYRIEDEDFKQDLFLILMENYASARVSKKKQEENIEQQLRQKIMEFCEPETANTSIWFLIDDSYDEDCVSDRTNPFSTVDSKCYIEYLSSCMDKFLTDREKKCMTLYFGIDESEVMSCRKVGEILGMSGERVRQIIYKAEKKMRNCDH